VSVNQWLTSVRVTFSIWEEERSGGAHRDRIARHDDTKSRNQNMLRRVLREFVAR